MIGAPALAANAALRSGAGLVTIACPESIYQSVATLCPCATTIPLPEAPNGQLDPIRALKVIDESRSFGAPARPTVIAAGPGLGRGNVRFDQSWRKLIQTFTVARGVPIVLDADGLNAMPPMHLGAENPNEHDWSNLILTPHPGEFARLCNMTVADVQSMRRPVITAAARKANEPVASSAASEEPTDVGRQRRDCVILLKGAETLVCDGVCIYQNETGNPGMATGGCGDVLTGIIAGLIAQGMSSFDAAVLGAHVHGKAGDLVAGETSQMSLMATDLIAQLRRVF